jgi:hypothetical protein
MKVEIRYSDILSVLGLILSLHSTSCTSYLYVRNVLQRDVFPFLWH